MAGLGLTTQSRCAVLRHMFSDCLGKSRLMSIIGNGLHIFKLVQHSLRQITNHARSVFEPISVDTNVLECVCLVIFMRVEETINKYDVI